MNKITQKDIKGLILAGGRSSRMGRDKSVFNYHGIPQKIFLKNLLENLGIETFFSVQERKQSKEIEDNLPDKGPISGICSAFQAHPNIAWLVLAVDLPFVDSELIDLLLERRNPSKMATAVRGQNNAYPEPLIAIYEPKAYPIIANYLAQGILSPKKILTESTIEIVEVDDALIMNVNTPQELREAKKLLA